MIIGVVCRRLVMTISLSSKIVMGCIALRRAVAFDAGTLLFPSATSSEIS
jgi:hypothetical protein